MRNLIGLIWLCDIFNFAGFEFLDTTLPINFLIWTLYFILFSTSVSRGDK